MALDIFCSIIPLLSLSSVSRPALSVSCCLLCCCWPRQSPSLGLALCCINTNGFWEKIILLHHLEDAEYLLCIVIFLLHSPNNSYLPAPCKQLEYLSWGLSLSQLLVRAEISIKKIILSSDEIPHSITHWTILHRVSYIFIYTQN